VNNRLLLTVLAALALTGCANDPAPNAQLQLTEQAVAQAASVGADTQLSEMQLAQDNLALAQKNMAEHDYKRARLLAEVAELDARLAEAKVLVAKSDAQISELQLKISRLRKQLGAQQ
jgi:septal ring factor EnvC (AmiA/AmiB activator)